MKVKVLKPFKDKHSGKLYQEGDTITISKERYREIVKGCLLVEEIKGTKPEQAAE